MPFKIAVIGGGVVGFTSAVRLQKKFGNVTLYTEEKSPNTTGDVSAGLWTPYLLQDTPAEKIIKWSKETQDYFLSLWKEGNAAKAGISLQYMVNLLRDSTTLPAWTKIAIGLTEFKAEQLERIRREYNNPCVAAFSFISFICEPTKFLPFLEEGFLKDGGSVVTEKIVSFAQLKRYDLVVNCTGIYSKILMGDDKVRAIRGQIIRVRAPWQFNVVMDDADDGNYVIPNENFVILGGTHQLDDVDLRPRSSDAEMIFAGCKKLSRALEKAEIVVHQAGLRPGRDELRLELTEMTVDGKLMPIIHNYGHGGSGVTLCYGCAGDVVDLAKAALAKNKL